MILGQPLLVRGVSTNHVWFLDLFRFQGPFLQLPMLEVLSAVTGESFGVFEEVDFAEGSVKAIKQRLAQMIGIPRFRLWLLQDNCPLDDDQTLIDDQRFTLQVVQLVILDFQPMTGSRIRASLWHVRKMMTSSLSSTWTSHEVPILKMQMQWRRCMRHPSMDVSNACLYW